MAESAPLRGRAQMTRNALPAAFTWLAVLTVAGMALAVGSVLGFVAFIAPPDGAAVPSAGRPTFTRPMRPNCGEVFYCMNASDPNPSYVRYWTPADGLPPLSFIPAFTYSSDVFDVSDATATRVRVSGVYQFVVFTPMISLTGSFDVAIILTRDPGLLLSTPALSGDLGSSGLANITAVPTRAATTTAMVYLEAGESVRVGYVTDADGVGVTPGAYFAGTLLNVDA